MYLCLSVPQHTAYVDGGVLFFCSSAYDSVCIVWCLSVLQLKWLGSLCPHTSSHMNAMLLAVVKYSFQHQRFHYSGLRVILLRLAGLWLFLRCCGLTVVLKQVWSCGYFPTVVVMWLFSTLLWSCNCFKTGMVLWLFSYCCGDVAVFHTVVVLQLLLTLL